MAAPDTGNTLGWGWFIGAQMPPRSEDEAAGISFVKPVSDDEAAQVREQIQLIERLAAAAAYSKLVEAFVEFRDTFMRLSTVAEKKPSARSLRALNRAAASFVNASAALVERVIHDVAEDFGGSSPEAQVIATALERPGLAQTRLLSHALSVTSQELRGVLLEVTAPTDEALSFSLALTRETLFVARSSERLPDAVKEEAAKLPEQTRALPLFVHLLQNLQHLEAERLLLYEERIYEASVGVRRMGAEILSGVPALMHRSPAPDLPNGMQLSFHVFPQGAIEALQSSLANAHRLVEDKGASLEPSSLTEELEPEIAQRASSTETAEQVELPGGRSGQTVSFRALVEHVVAMTDELEKAWSASLDAEHFATAREGVHSQWQSMLVALRRRATAADQELTAAGISPLAPAFPPEVDELGSFSDEPDPDQRLRQLHAAQTYALLALLTAMKGLDEPSAQAMNLLTGQLEESWWEAGAFSLIRSRARLLGLVEEELELAEAALTDPDGVGMHESERAAGAWFEHLRLVSDALSRGDAEAALTHELTAFRLRLGQILRERGYPLPASLGAALAQDDDLRSLGTIVGKLEAAVARLAEGNGLNVGLAVPLAFGASDVIYRFCFEPPVVALERVFSGHTPDTSAEVALGGTEGDVDG